VNDTGIASTGFLLQQNFPNPVHNTTCISFQIPVSGKVRVEVLNEIGNLVDVPVKQPPEWWDSFCILEQQRISCRNIYMSGKFWRSDTSRKMMVIH